jgi:hypothetical protein
MKKQNKWLDNFGKADNANESNVSMSEDFVGLAYDTSGRNYSPSWGGQFAMGGSIPGSPGFTYARTAGSAPSEGKYAKKTMPSAQNGQEIQKQKYNESTLENIFEIFDPTGISSWNDVAASYMDTGMSDETKLEIFGALPLLGKVGKAGKYLSKVARNQAIPSLLRAIPYVGRGTDAVQAVQQYQSAPLLPSAPPAEVGQFGRYAGMGKMQNGGEMKFYQEGLDWKPKSMQDGGQQPLRVSTTDPRYAELYKNKQLGRWLDENNFDSQVPLDEVVVTGKDESLKEAMYQGSNRFLQNAFGVLGSSQTVPMELFTGKQQTPSEAWGFNTEGLSWYNPKSISNFAMDAVLDPMNAIGVGVADDILRASGRSIGKRVEFDPIQLSRLEPADFNFDLPKFKRSRPQLRGYEDDQVIANVARTVIDDNQLPPPPSMIHIPNSTFRQMTAAEKRQGVKDFLNYRDINSLGVQNFRDTEEAIDGWLTRNRFELPSDIDIQNRMSNLFKRYNIPVDDDFPEAVRNLPQNVKPQFLQEFVSTLPRKFTDDELMQMRIRYQDAQQSAAASSQPVIRNRSGLTKDEVIQRSKDKDKVSKMTEEEFQNTVLKPSGEIAEYVRGMDIDKLTYDPSSGRTILKDQRVMSEQEYADAFNQRIDLLNEIIADKNKSGVQYKVKELSPSGYLKFETPEQFIENSNVTVPAGESVWSVRLNPGQWRGEVEDIANSDYYRSIPGLEMSNTTGTVFSDRTPRKGTGAYESINEYLKQMDLGRVKPGFNSQTAFSKGAWENFIKTNRGVGYYANPNLVYGTMKTMLPVGFGASYLYNQNSEFKQGGVIKDNRGQWDHPGEITEINSNYITTRPDPLTGKTIDYDILAVSNTGDTKLMEPGKDYKFKGKKVTEFPLKAQEGIKVPEVEGSTLPEVLVTDIPERISRQNQLIQGTSPKRNYSIVDKKNNYIYYFSPKGEKIGTEPIITGASNNDVDVSPSMREFFEMRDTDNHEEYFQYLKDTKGQTTPSGIYSISGLRTDTAKNPDKLGSLFNKLFRPEREKEIEDIRIKDYGAQQNLFTLQSEFGVPSSKAIHGTMRDDRVDALENYDRDRNMSNGCVNVNGETMCFETLGKGSGVYILPEESDDLLYPSEKNNKERKTNKNYRNTRSTIAQELLSRGIEPEKEALDFIASVAEKETKGGRSKFAAVEQFAPHALAKSQGKFQIDPSAFKQYLPEDYDGSDSSGAEAVYNFFNENKEIDPVNMYRKYTGDEKGKYDKKFKSIYDKMSIVYRDGGRVGINDLDAQPKKKLNQLLNFTNNPDKDWLKKYQ